MDRTNLIEKPSTFAYGIRSVSILSVTAAAVTLGLLLSGSDYLTQAYFWHNTIDNVARSKVIVAPAAAAAIAAIVAVAVLWSFARRNCDVSEHVWRIALTCSPLAPLAVGVD
jgi:TRAP-type C4-dicarboxylate transport system permease small subunit